MEVETGQIAAVIDKTDQWENVDFRQYKGLSLGDNVRKVTKQNCQQSTTKQKEKNQKKKTKKKIVSKAKQKEKSTATTKKKIKAKQQN